MTTMISRQLGDFLYVWALGLLDAGGAYEACVRHPGYVVMVQRLDLRSIV